MDPSIRPKTPPEIAAEKRREHTERSELMFIRAMSWSLHDCGYTRDSSASDVQPGDMRYAVGKGIKALVAATDWSFAGEFISESGGERADHDTFSALADFMIAPSDFTANVFAQTVALRSRWHGESWLQKALDLLPSASEIERDRKVDQDIDERKLA